MAFTTLISDVHIGLAATSPTSWSSKSEFALLPAAGLHCVHLKLNSAWGSTTVGACQLLYARGRNLNAPRLDHFSSLASLRFATRQIFK